jgi:hypothetical protein
LLRVRFFALILVNRTSPVLIQVRARLARDQAVLRSGEFLGHSGNDEHMDADPRKRAAAHADLTVMVRLKDDEEGAARQLATLACELKMPCFLAYLHSFSFRDSTNTRKQLPDASDGVFDGKMIDFHARMLYDNLYMTHVQMP